MTHFAQEVHGVDPTAHTMGLALERYVLPKVPDWLFRYERPVEVVPAVSILELAEGKGRKLFNSRRPAFVASDDAVYCRVTPGHSYGLHYGYLIATAAIIRGALVAVTVASPKIDTIRSFIRDSLPPLPTADIVIVGYVESLQLANSADVPWVMSSGWGWKIVHIGCKRALLLGCQFSYWGDIAGHLVAELYDRQITDWVLYVGKVGTTRAHVRPNRMLATGTESLIDGLPIHWISRMANCFSDDDGILCGARHVTVNSVVEETMSWLDRYGSTYDVVDPEIGHMGAAASNAGAAFDYLHLVTDCLAADYGVGLYDERAQDVVARRTTLLRKVSCIIEKSVNRS